MLIKVTQDHIDCGRRRHSRACPVALAFIDAGVPDVHVILASFIPKTNAARVPLPGFVGRNILRFDDNQLINPFEFEVNYNVD